ncbi:hypothetical protein NIIDMKKI_55160 [Mycobacterium kansasii]|uniref:PPE family protein n=1 Tax=Mycobacterium kansasii TaxID=1768 RepID=A0A7G1IHM3_MYCKA|nr:hypothetical protein NIIDMKKI_55160 [Mycobacterium kansasii]
MSFWMWPPEVNSVLLLEGPGSGPMLEAAAAWDGIGTELSSAANAFGSITSDLGGQAWQGAASASMTTAASRYVDWLGRTAAQAEQSAAQARAAAIAYEAALAGIVHPELITANRGQLVSLVVANLFGQNAPAIAAAEAAYEQMWAQDVVAMGGYHSSASATVALLAPWEQALQNLPGLPGELAKAIGNGFALAEQEIQQTPRHWPPHSPGYLTPSSPASSGHRLIPLPGNGGGNFHRHTIAGDENRRSRAVAGKALLNLSGLETQISAPGSPLLALFASDIPPLSWFLGNSPPPFLNLLLGQTVQYTTYNGMSVVQITPAHPTGEYVVAIHGGAFIFPPSFLHWINYSVMAQQTGATVQVPIYPLLQQGGTAGTVVPTMAGFISTQIAQHQASNVSVIGDSAGGNLALAATQYLVDHGVPCRRRWFWCRHG